MSSVLAVIPLGLAAAVSPVMLAEQSVLVASPGGRRSGVLYALGTALVLAAVMASVIVLGRSVELPQLPRLDASMDVVLGIGLVGLGAALHLRASGSRPRSRPTASSRGPVRPEAAFGFGVFSMATNVTTLALVIVAAKDIASSGSSVPLHIVAGLVVVALATIPAWGPVALVDLPGLGTRSALEAASAFLSRNGPRLVVVILVVIGAGVTARGVLRMLNLLPA